MDSQWTVKHFWKVYAFYLLSICYGWHSINNLNPAIAGKGGREMNRVVSKQQAQVLSVFMQAEMNPNGYIYYQCPRSQNHGKGKILAHYYNAVPIRCNQCKSLMILKFKTI